ncbi:unnamed protein product [Rotaria magnacalcarata]|uniref:PH domain-containing protein n=2 Tax=Rotaria magnacalcarata TaxID=392030 RepID=A0A815WWD4_9BILA|nr:unnamed protein product [Rotaria magnacalcarata]CAF1548596.1 unnamed protein product [Rotaria magnacalcarata]CAF2152956.1 unnamed protein product [Rotaria magnacalcarata]CAF2225829.1 unnamed protein product [Rotaria magnacalcarata]CAF4125200.1 unnamed protein product [Rotaria magnacalcarata]
MADIVKAGWLFRRTTVLKNWKREWFILTNDARLRRMSDPAKQFDKADDVFQLSRCRELRIGTTQVPYNIDPPEDATRAQLMQLVPGEGDPWTLCAESTDDLLAWQTSFDDVRQLHIERLQQQQAQLNNIRFPTGRYDFAHYPGVYQGNFPHQVYRAPDGSTHTVIFVERGARYNDGSGIAAGALTGMAIGSLMWWPFFMFPLMWC